MEMQLNLNEFRKEMIKEMMDDTWTTLLIPMECYVVSAKSPNSEKYEIFFNGEKIKDVYGVIRYGESIKELPKKDINWKKEIEGE